MSDRCLCALPRDLRRGRGRVPPAALAALTLCLAAPAWGETLDGPLTAVRDVDTIVVDHVAIRLQGVDGPEVTSAAGQAARRWMIAFLDGKSLRCVLNGQRSHDRRVGICYAEGADIGAAAIAAGQALDCPRFSNGRYRHLETPRARAARVRAPYC